MSDGARTAASPGLERVLAAAADRYRRLGRVGGTARITNLAAHEARAIAHLSVTGRTLAHVGGTVTVDLRRLDTALEHAGGLVAVLRAGGHNLTTHAQLRTAEQSDTETAWSTAAAGAASARDVAWIADLRSRRGGQPPDGLPLVARSLALLDGLRRWDRARLANAAGADPHALDDDLPTAALLADALAFRDGVDAPANAPDRRVLLARHGVVTDPLSSTVLVSGLRLSGTGPAAALLRAADGGHLRLTLAQVTSSDLRKCAGDLFTCEGAIVVRAAEAIADTPLVCTEGQPSSACDALLRQVVPSTATVKYSGDFDWGGLRIAGLMRRRYGARPWRHDVATYARAADAAGGRPSSLAAPRGRSPAGFEQLWASVDSRRVPIWQEDIADVLVEDLQDTA